MQILAEGDATWITQGVGMATKAVLFDINGTLEDSNDFHIAAWQEVFAKAGQTFDRQIIHDQLGKSRTCPSPPSAKCDARAGGGARQAARRDLQEPIHQASAAVPKRERHCRSRRSHGRVSEEALRLVGAAALYDDVSTLLGEYDSSPLNLTM
jgi:phosphoglycolate phosphatase-like HAD superfamily hydrolase